jgi:hypothetical protein
LSTQEEEDEGIIIEKPNKTNKQKKEHAYNTYVIHRNVNCSTHGKKFGTEKVRCHRGKMSGLNDNRLTIKMTHSRATRTKCMICTNKTKT